MSSSTGHNVGTFFFVTDVVHQALPNRFKLNQRSLLHRDRPSTTSTQKVRLEEECSVYFGQIGTSEIKRNEADEGFGAKATNYSNVVSSSAMVNN